MNDSTRMEYAEIIENEHAQTQEAVTDKNQADIFSWKRAVDCTECKTSTVSSIP